MLLSVDAQSEPAGCTQRLIFRTNEPGAWRCSQVPADVSVSDGIPSGKSIVRLKMHVLHLMYQTEELSLAP